MSKKADAREAWRCITKLFVGTEMHERFHEAAEEAGVGHPGALRLLLQLKPFDSPSMREIAASMRCDASWVTALVDALERVGFVKRLPHPTDRRVKLVHITPTGITAQQRALDVLARPPKAVEQLSAEETKTLAVLLRRVTQP